MPTSRSLPKKSAKLLPRNFRTRSSNSSQVEEDVKTAAPVAQRGDHHGQADDHDGHVIQGEKILTRDFSADLIRHPDS